MDLFAFVDFGEIGGIAIGFGLVVVLPVIGLLLSHQRKMAELLHRGPGPQSDGEKIQRLENEVAELKNRINHLILVVDEKAALQERVGPPKLPNSL